MHGDRAGLTSSFVRGRNFINSFKYRKSRNAIRESKFLRVLVLSIIILFDLINSCALIVHTVNARIRNACKYSSHSYLFTR